MREPPHTWDIFCRVVDNLGDVGVCWRLARQLAAEHGAAPRLWIDDLASLRLLHPLAADVECQSVEGVEIRRWTSPWTPVSPADVVIEAFGCGLPDEYVDVLEQDAALWIVLEYLSAEPWVPGHHGLPSPHTRLPLERYYFFPGFVQGTGGLLCEPDLLARRKVFDGARKREFWRSVGHAPPPADVTTISLFAYENAPLAELLHCWENGDGPIIAVIPEGRLLEEARRFCASTSSSRVFLRGRLEVRAQPFLPQARYDELLWACDCNFVRGEDSFVRAQWAQSPFVWQLYPQRARAHWAKLEAFLALYGEGLPAGARDSASQLMRLWNQIDVRGVTIASAWQAYSASLATLKAHGAGWAGRIAGIGGLADNLARFSRSKLK